MQFFAVVSLLAGTVLALDIRLYSGGGCKGGFTYCGGANPNVCCYTPSNGAGSIQFIPYPSNWYIETDGFENGGCTSLRTSTSEYGQTSNCLNSGKYTGGSYKFLNAKRGMEMVERTSATPKANCTRANIYVSPEGKETSLAHLSDEDFVKFIDSA